MGSIARDVQSQLELLAGDVFHIHRVEQWIILTSNQFDLHLPDETGGPPFQSLHVLYNWQTQEFVCRTMGRCLERGSFDSLDQLAQFAQDTFQGKSACIGSGDFPASSVFSEGCAKYRRCHIPSPALPHIDDSTLSLRAFRCESCQKDVKTDKLPVTSDPNQSEIKSEVSNTNLDPKVEMTLHSDVDEVDHDEVDYDDDDDGSGPPGDYELLKTEVELDAETESSAMEMNDLVDYIKDEHDQSYSIFDSDGACLRKKKRGRPSKRSCRLKSQPKYFPDTIEKQKVKIIYPKNVNHKPRADGKFECEYCGHAVTSRSGKTDHKKLNHGWGHFGCELCPTVYKEALDFIRHMMDAHVGVLEAMCPQCQQRVHFEGDEQVFEGHYSACVRSHRVSQNAKQIALRRENKPDPVQCTCDTCGRLFNTLETLKIHQRIHQGKGFVCKECGFWASHRSVLTSHMQKHEREKGTATELVCPHCAHVCLGESQYTNHIKRRHQPYQCTQCSEVCLGKRLLNIHNSEVHGANRCEICAMCFGTSNLLRRHKLTHLEPSFSCRFCPKMFKAERCLVNHERVHTGETPFKCRLCDYKCKSSATLSLHKKFKHNGGKRLRKPDDEDIDD
ncbi:zinc finger protein 718-like [Tigriopus californicus]|uniref:zinc finger protein 718-like n=1 Tax=Tigriopus californicus TaxID=6832 RepID=UPI0027D9D6C9|nr:zinc finger protein 718-like [Tigriopus californicus]